MLQAGARIADGQLPYRDFWSNYPPGQPLMLGALQGVLGPSLLAWRIVRVATNGVITLFAYRLVRRGAPEPYALAAGLAVAAAMAFPTGPGPNPPALLLTFAALLSARKRPGLAGAIAGLACLFRLELGIAAIIGVELEAPPGSRARAAIAAIACALVTLLPFFVAAPGAMLHDTLGFYGIQGLQRLPFPLDFHGPVRPSKLIEFYIPLILVVGLALWALSTAVRFRAAGGRNVARRALAERELDVRALSLFPLAAVALVYLLGRADEFHLVPLAAVLPVMLALAAAAAGSSRALRGAMLLVLALIALHGLDRQAGQLLHPPNMAAVPGPAGDGVETDVADARALAALERVLQAITRPREPIFVANPRHDLVHAGDPLLYVILGHPNATRYDVMQPGIVTTAAVQREIVSSLERAHTRVVVRWLDPRASLAEPNGSARSSGVHILDRYLATHFRPSARFGVYQLLVRSTSRTASSA